jgi:hypothetical protein
MKISENQIEIIAAILLLTALIFTYIYSDEIDGTVSYDCRLAEISVDYPVAVKEQCRKLMEGKK